MARWTAQGREGKPHAPRLDGNTGGYSACTRALRKSGVLRCRCFSTHRQCASLPVKNKTGPASRHEKSSRAIIMVRVTSSALHVSRFDRDQGCSSYQKNAMQRTKSINHFRLWGLHAGASDRPSRPHLWNLELPPLLVLSVVSNVTAIHNDGIMQALWWRARAGGERGGGVGATLKRCLL